MSDLAQARTDLAALVDDVVVEAPGFGPVTVPVVTVAPEEATAPCLITGPADPYIDFDGISFGEKRINLVVLAVGEGVNEAAAAQIDDMVSACLIRLLAAESGFQVDQVDRPGKTTLNGQACLGVVVRVSRNVPLGL